MMVFKKPSKMLQTSPFFKNHLRMSMTENKFCIFNLCLHNVQDKEFRLIRFFFFPCKPLPHLILWMRNYIIDYLAPTLYVRYQRFKHLTALNNCFHYIPLFLTLRNHSRFNTGEGCGVGFLAEVPPFT